MPKAWGLAGVVFALSCAAASAQPVPSARVAILQADERSAREPRDLATIRGGVRSADGETARAAIRGLARLHRPALVADILPALKAALPEVRAEAANAIADSLCPPAVATSAAVDSASSSLKARLDVEAEANVRFALLEAIGRLPYQLEAQIARAEGVLTAYVQSDFVMDRLGVAKGLEALSRLAIAKGGPRSQSVAALRRLLDVPAPDPADLGESLAAITAGPDRTHEDARVRRLAFEALTALGAIDEVTIRHAAADGDPQVRRLALLATSAHPAFEGAQPIVARALEDPAAMVRGEAIAIAAASIGTDKGDAGCQAALDATHDQELTIVVHALDALGGCAAFPGVTAYLEQIVESRVEGASSRGWQRTVHAYDALVRVAPDGARALLPKIASSPAPQVRARAASAAGVLNEKEVLTTLTQDPDPIVQTAAHKALGAPGRAPQDPSAEPGAPASDIDPVEMRRLVSPRARVTIRDVGTLELALFTTETPATVLRFARLVNAGYFNDMVLMSRDPAAATLVAADNERAAGFNRLHKETALWPHVRGSVGLTLDGSGPRGAVLFVNLVDNPRYDHEVPVFAQVLNGIDLLDRLLPGDVIERIEIVP